ncbi:MAG: hypothetical protein RIS70_1672 [Planctomycetota bacterium]
MRYTRAVLNVAMFLALAISAFFGQALQGQVKDDAADEQQAPDFDRQVAPLLASRCLDCHSGSEAKGGLDLTRRERAIGGGESGPAYVAGDLGKSLLWSRVESDEMPPKKPLDAAEKRLLRRWIEHGAAWGTDPIDRFRISTSTRAGLDWWSFQPVVRPKPPQVSGEGLIRNAEIRNPIDQFIRARLAEQGLTPSPSADRRTLIRRLAFDLVGLPPSPEEVEAFERDDDPIAYEKLVNRYLESPHYGERWARHWLDVARYGETDGFERNGRRPTAWHYRNWVIQSLNSDMPYDEFCRWQIAGDVLAPGNPDAVLATGFLVAGVHNTVLGNDMMRAIARQDELEEMVGNVCQTMLGLTANCGRCHDHKFDPIPQVEYYRLASALSGVQHGEREVVRVEVAEEIRAIDAKIGDIEAKLRLLESPVRKAIMEEQTSGKQRGKTGGDLTVAVPDPVAAWDLRKGLKDQVGATDLQSVGNVELSAEHGAHVAGGAYLKSAPLKKSLTTKTLEAWVRLDNLTQQGGGVISIESPDGQFFDAIVYGEQESQRWMAGSNGFTRTGSFQASAESDAANRVVHVAIVYGADGMITGYRDGVRYGTAYKSSGPFGFEKDKSVVVLGCRHDPPGGNRMLAGTIVQARLYDRPLEPKEIEASARWSGLLITDNDIASRLNGEDRKRREDWKAERDALRSTRSQREAQNRFRAYATLPGQPAETRVLRRGDVASPADVVAPGGIHAVLSELSDFKLAPGSPESERRVKLSQWITSRDNPLFARVIVNRLWHYHFGVGLVETPSDFGFNGGRPSHPELLDWLAAELIDRQFRLKELHRLMVTSATYRQASTPRAEAIAKDAENRLLWRKRPQRMEGEILRDSLLAVTGLLNRELYGEGFSDYRMVDAMNGTMYYEPYDPVEAAMQRRSIYRFTPRGGNQGFLDVFDCPDPAASAPRRNSTTTPLQALAMWNGDFSLRMADSMAQRIQQSEPQDIERQVRDVYRLALQRSPGDAERIAARELVERHGLRALCRAMLNSNEFMTIQ